MSTSKGKILLLLVLLMGFSTYKIYIFQTSKSSYNEVIESTQEYNLDNSDSTIDVVKFDNVTYFIRTIAGNTTKFHYSIDFLNSTGKLERLASFSFSVPVNKPIFSNGYLILLTQKPYSYKFEKINPEISVYDLRNRILTNNQSITFSEFIDEDKYVSYSKQVFTANIVSSTLYIYEYEVKRENSSDSFTNSIILNAFDMNSNEKIWSKNILSDKSEYNPYFYDFKAYSLENEIIFSFFIHKRNLILETVLTLDGEIISKKEMSTDVCDLQGCEDGRVISEKESIVFDKTDRNEVEFASKRGLRYVWGYNLTLNDATLINFNLIFSQVEPRSNNLQVFTIISEFLYNNGSIIETYHKAILLITNSFMRLFVHGSSLYDASDFYVISNYEVLIINGEQGIFISYSNINISRFFVPHISNVLIVLIIILVILIMVEGVSNYMKGWKRFN